MTEAEWLTCNDPARMLKFLRAGSAPFVLDEGVRNDSAEVGTNFAPMQGRGGTSSAPTRQANGQRKLWLFACACCRRIWDLLIDERSRKTVEFVERLADELGSGEEWGVAWQEANLARAE